MPRQILYARKNAFRLSLIIPSTAIVIQSLKLYIGYQRIDDKVVHFININ